MTKKWFPDSLMKTKINAIIYDLAQKAAASAPESLVERIVYYYPRPEEWVRQIKIDFGVWLRSVIYLTIKLLVQFVTMVICCWLLMNFLNYLWFFYSNTEAGRHFLAHQPSKAIIHVTQLLHQDTFSFVLGMCFNVVVITAACGAILSFTAVKRYLYDCRGISVQTLFILGFTYLTVYQMESYNSYSELNGLAFLYFLPVLGLMDAVLNLVSRIVPEFLLFRRMKKKFHEMKNIADIRNTDPR